MMNRLVRRVSVRLICGLMVTLLALAACAPVVEVTVLTPTPQPATATPALALTPATSVSADVTIQQGTQARLGNTSVGLVRVRRGEYDTPSGKQRGSVATLAYDGQTLTVYEDLVIDVNGQRWRVAAVIENNPGPDAAPGSNRSYVRLVSPP